MVISIYRLKLLEKGEIRVKETIQNVDKLINKALPEDKQYIIKIKYCDVNLGDYVNIQIWYSKKADNIYSVYWLGAKTVLGKVIIRKISTTEAIEEIAKGVFELPSNSEDIIKNNKLMETILEISI